MQRSRYFQTVALIHEETRGEFQTEKCAVLLSAQQFLSGEDQ